MAKTESTKRKLKPEIEKKRRDRINSNLEALRDLLYKTTADTRLQNHKLEKAEILDLAVQYIRKTTDRKPEARGTSNRLNSKITSNQSQASASAGLFYPSDFDPCISDPYGRFHPSEQKEALRILGANLDNLTAKTGNEPTSQINFSQAKILLTPSDQSYHQEVFLHSGSGLCGSTLSCQRTCHSRLSSSSSSSSHYSPPSSPTFTSISSSPSNSPPYCSTSCPLPLPLSLPPPPDASSPPIATLLPLHRPVMAHQSLLPHMAKDLTPPQSPVLALRQEQFLLPAQSTWRPWS